MAANDTNKKAGKQHLATSIGRSTNTKIKNKHKRRMSKKRYRGQGK